MSADLAAVASRIAAAGRAAWPGVVLAEDLIAKKLADRVASDPDTKLDTLHDADLYLAMALAEGDAAALKAFETDMVPQMDMALRRLRLGAASRKSRGRSRTTSAARVRAPTTRNTASCSGTST